mgnify:FL=1|jgi:hypothetical protein
MKTLIIFCILLLQLGLSQDVLADDPDKLCQDELKWKLSAPDEARFKACKDNTDTLKRYRMQVRTRGGGFMQTMGMCILSKKDENAYEITVIKLINPSDVADRVQLMAELPTC